MKTITQTCPDCGTVVAGNVLEEYRVIKCPRVGCSMLLRFEDLAEDSQRYILEHREDYHID